MFKMKKAKLLSQKLQWKNNQFRCQVACPIARMMRISSVQAVRQSIKSGSAGTWHASIASPCCDITHGSPHPLDGTSLGSLAPKGVRPDVIRPRLISLTSFAGDRSRPGTRPSYCRPAYCTETSWAWRSRLRHFVFPTSNPRSIFSSIHPYKKHCRKF